MAQVAVTIGGRTFRVACGDGEEEYLSGLARDLDSRIENLRESVGEVGDNKLVIMAALTFADELADLRRKFKALEDEVGLLRHAREDVLERIGASEEAVARALEQSAHRVEKLAHLLSRPIDADIPEA